MRERFDDPTDARCRMPEDENAPKPEVGDATFVTGAAKDEKSAEGAEDGGSIHGWSSASVMTF